MLYPNSHSFNMPKLQTSNTVPKTKKSSVNNKRDALQKFKLPCNTGVQSSAKKKKKIKKRAKSDVFLFSKLVLYTRSLCCRLYSDMAWKFKIHANCVFATFFDPNFDIESFPKSMCVEIVSNIKFL